MDKLDRLTLFLIVVTTPLIGCSGGNSQKNETSPSTKTDPTEQIIMPVMPDDFGFFVSFGYGMKDTINTFDGTVTADISLTDEEMLDVYEQMKEITVTEQKQFVPEPIDGEMCIQSPHEDDKWKITFDGEMIRHNISGEHCEPTEDTEQFIKLRNFVFSKIRRKDEYHELPIEKVDTIKQSLQKLWLLLKNNNKAEKGLG